MSKLVKQEGWGLGLAAGALAAAATVVACGDEFGSDCKATHTCVASGGEAGQPDEEPGSGGGQEGGASPLGTGGAPAGADGGEGGAESDDQPFAVVSMSPVDGAADAEPDSSVVLTFSEPLDPDSVSAASVQVLDGDTVVPGTLSSEDATVTFTPDEPFALFVEYAVEVSRDVTTADGQELAEDYQAAFTVRDGVWHGVELATNVDEDSLPRSLLVGNHGDTLLGWTLFNQSQTCSSSVRWFNRGKPLGPATTFTIANQKQCYLSLAANTEGVAALATAGFTLNQEGEAVSGEGKISEYRAGKWANFGVTNTAGNGIGVAPDGAVSYLLLTFPGVIASVNRPSGLTMNNKPIGGLHLGLSIPAFAFDVRSNGFAAWLGEVEGSEPYQGPEEILAARYTAEDGWDAATVLPESVAEFSGDNHHRSVPALAVDDSGGAMVLWVRETGAVETGELMASRYTSAGGWQAPVLLSGAQVVGYNWTPGLVFDGETYVAAWTGKAGHSPFPYTARYDMDLSEWSAPEPHSETAVVDSMPRLAVDGHHNLLMTWLTPSPSGVTLTYARYSAKTVTWSDPVPVPEGDVGAGLYSLRPAELSVNESGLGALLWAAAPDFREPATLHYASFH